MKKDIKIPVSENVYLAIALEKNEVFKTEDWNVYIVNNNLEPIELVLIVSNGFNKNKTTATLRHKIDILPAKSGAKVEFLQQEVLSLNNEFKVSYFKESKMYEKTFTIKANSIKKSKVKWIELIQLKAILFT